MAALTRDTTARTGDLIPALLKQPGPRADLKRCLLQPPDSPAWDRAWGHLIAYLPEEHAPDHVLIGRAVVDEQRAFMTVAAMICNQSSTARTRDLQAAAEPLPNNLGASLAKGVAAKVYTREGGLHRLILLSRQNIDGIHRLLPGTVKHLRDKGVAIDWVPLIGDLADWRRYRRDIARRWIQEYSRALHRIGTDQHRTVSNAESETP